MIFYNVRIEFKTIEPFYLSTLPDATSESERVDTKLMTTEITKSRRVPFSEAIVYFLQFPVEFQEKRTRRRFER
jgi:hypothetical protein